MSASMSRRSFARLSMVALGSVFGLGLTVTAARADANLKFELYEDKAHEYRWRLRAGNSEILAIAGQGYKAKADAKAGVERLRKDLDRLTSETYQDAKHGDGLRRLQGRVRGRIRRPALHGRRLARSRRSNRRSLRPLSLRSAPPVNHVPVAVQLYAPPSLKVTTTLPGFFAPFLVVEHVSVSPGS